MIFAPEYIYEKPVVAGYDPNTSFVPSDSAREAIKSQAWRKRIVQGRISPYSPFELVSLESKKYLDP